MKPLADGVSHSDTKKVRINTGIADYKHLPVSTAVKWGDLLFVTGQVGVDHQTGRSPGGIEAQTKVTLENLKTVLECAGSSLENVLKTTVFLTNMEDFESMNTVYKEFFADNPPARSTVEVSALARADWLIEIEAIAGV